MLTTWLNYVADGLLLNYMFAAPAHQFDQGSPETKALLKASRLIPLYHIHKLECFKIKT